MILSRDIIITGLQAWNISIGSNCKNIALEFSEHNRVLYISPPLDILSNFRNPQGVKQLKDIERDAESGLLLHKIKDNLWVFYPETVVKSINQISINWLFDYLNYQNNKKLAKEILLAISHLQFSNYIHFCDSDMFRSFYFKELLKPSITAYYTRDNLMAVKYWQKQGKRIEPLFMEKADLVLANSSYLAQLALKHNKKSFNVGQGCDISNFKPDKNYAVPIDIKFIPSPRIGYIGSLNALRLDISIIEHIAKENPRWNIVLVGPEDNEFADSGLHGMDNVHFLGNKKEKELPVYLSAFDVAINPQKLNDVTIGNYPRKIDEYLAMGISTVASKTETMMIFKDHVSLASYNEQWNYCIHKELNTNSNQKREDRIAFAKNHTWENNVSEIYAHIQEAEYTKKNVIQKRRSEKVTSGS